MEVHFLSLAKPRTWVLVFTFHLGIRWAARLSMSILKAISQAIAVKVEGYVFDLFIL
jgi:hypothetical protein